MPTKLPRHTITETPAVQAALDELRRETGEDRPPLGELVILGAREKLRRTREERASRDELLAGLADRIRRGESLVDPVAADEVHRSGWAHD